MGTRAALRVLPLALSSRDLSDDQLLEEETKRTALATCRSAFIACTANLHGRRAKDLTLQAASASESASSRASTANFAETGSAIFAAAAAAGTVAADPSVDVQVGTAYFHKAGAVGLAVAAVKHATSAAQATRVSDAAASIWESVTEDARLLSSGKDPLLIRQPLWLMDVRGNPDFRVNFPIWARVPFDILDNSQLVADSEWRIWLDWYRAILSGSGNHKLSFGERIDVDIATKKSEFWERDPDEVMTDLAEIVGWTPPEEQTIKEFILKLLDRESRPFSIDEIYEAFVTAELEVPRPSIRGRLNTLTDERRVKRLALATYASLTYNQKSPPPPIPDVQPAAIEPLWQNGKLVLPIGPLAADLDPASLIAALAALRDELVELADDAITVKNIDQRPAEYLRRLANRIPDVMPSQALLFRLGHARDVLDGFAGTTDAEWPDFLAARFRKLMLQYDRTVRQFPKWRAFVRNAADQRLTNEQIEEVPRVIESLIEELKTKDAQEFIEQSIPETLQATSAPIADWDETLRSGNEQLAEDLLESANNILKRTAELALALKSAGIDPIASWSSTTAKESLETFGKEAKKSIVKEFGKFGKATGPALGRFLKRLAKITTYGGASTGGSVLLLHRLFGLYPETFGWLEPVLRFLHLL